MATKRRKPELTPQTLFDYAVKFADEAEKMDRYPQFPTFRQAAAYFRVRIGVIEETIEEWCGDGYMKAAVGFRCGSGYGVYDHKGEYLVEAYREETVHA